MRRLAALTWLAFWIGACAGPQSSPSASVETAPILFVNVGEQVQAAPPTEELAVALSEAIEAAEANGADLGYPWIDSSNGELVLSVVTPRGRDLVGAAHIAVPYRTRNVAHGAAELRRIQDDVTRLRSQGVPEAELIYATLPDDRDNRTLVVIRAPSDPLLEALAARYPAGTVAVEINPNGR